MHQRNTTENWNPINQQHGIFEKEEKNDSLNGFVVNHINVWRGWTQNF